MKPNLVLHWNQGLISTIKYFKYIMLNKKFFWLASSLVILASCGGCKKAVSKGNQELNGSAFSRSVQDTVYFGFDKSGIEGEAKLALEKQAEWIKAHPQNFTVQGHCDERGTREYNLALGNRRAEAAKQYLVQQGVKAEHLNTISYGKEKPVDAGHDLAAHAKNRRAVTVLGGVDNNAY